MTRDDLLWVGIKLGGFYALMMALFGLPAAVVFLMIAPSVDFGSELTITMMGSALSQSVGVLFYALTGLYLTFRGDAIFRLLARPNSTSAET